MVRPKVDPALCVVCKGGRLLCGKNTCPILMKQLAKIRYELNNIPVEVFGPSPPAIFVGHHGYPKVSAGPLVPLSQHENASVLDSPEKWFGMSLEQILKYRISLVRSSFKTYVRRLENRFIETSQLISIACKPVDIEVKFTKQPRFILEVDSHSQPMGPIGRIRDIKLAENPKTSRKIEYIINDDIKASDAIFNLYTYKVPISQISRVLSAGLLGSLGNRKLVPTRWSITAVDQIVSNKLLEEIKHYPLISHYYLFTSSYLDNHFKILLIPRAWSFEQIEGWAPNSAWVINTVKPIIVSDFEDYKGRTDYPHNVAGAYYAARLAVCEYLKRIRKQASALVLREVRGGYIFPVGVWQVRENVRNAFLKGGLKYDNLNELLDNAFRDLKIPPHIWLSKSKLYQLIKSQTRLDSFFKKRELKRKI
ncbi:MAG: Nre family DNA repair protein [Candidatus Odinarchaeia archaeon]